MSEANNILQRIDINSGIDINYKIGVTEWYAGLPIDDAKLDGDIYRKKGNLYYQKTIDNKTLLKINNITDLRLQNAYYEGQEVVLLGYYESGDKEPIVYKFTINNFDFYVDDGGSLIKSSRGTWVAKFGNEINLLHFGAKGDNSFDNVDILEKGLLYASSNGKRAYLPSGYFKISRTLSIKFNLNFEGNGNTTGGTFIVYDGNETAVRFKKDNYVAGQHSSWIYASNFGKIGISTSTKKTNSIALELWGVSESNFANFSCANFEKAVKLIDCSIDRFDFPIINGCGDCFDFANYDNINRYVVNANIRIEGGDYYGNNNILKLNSINGLYFDSANWVESNNNLIISSNETDFVEVKEIEILNYQGLYNTNTFQSMINISNSGSTFMLFLMKIIGGNSNFVSTIINNSLYPINIQDSGLSVPFIRIDMLEHTTYSQFDAIINSSSYHLHWSSVNCTNYDASNLTLRIKDAKSDSFGLSTSQVSRGKTTKFGKNSDDDTLSTVLIHDKNGSGGTLFKVKKGDFQDVNLVELGTNVMVDKNENIKINLQIFADNASAISGGLIVGNLYRDSSGSLRIVI